MPKVKLKKIDEKKVKEILERYKCPLKYHEVRTRIMGAIATPAASVMPMRVINELWNNKMPEFKSIDEVNELMGMMIEGVWNSLTRHQKRTDPFHLTNVTIEHSRLGLGAYVRIRVEEIDGFVMGLFNGLDKMEFSKRVTESLDRLGEARKIFAGIEALVKDISKDVPQKELEITFKKILPFTPIIEKELNNIIMQCVLLRRLTMHGPNGVKPVYQ